jgi:GNAT superfamily N-acetyltransferase
MFARMPNATVESGPDLLRVKTGLPHELLNGIFRARIPEEDPEAAINAALKPFRSDRTPVLWWVGPSSEPRYLGKYLENCGLARVSELSGMAIDMKSLQVSAGIPHELSIEPVRDEAMLHAFLEALAGGYEMPKVAIDRLFAFLHEVGLGPGSPFHHYVGSWQGRPVASSTLFYGAGVAGIYMTVIPEFRKRGISAAMTLSPLRMAQAAGFRVGVTHVPDYRLGFHRKLGFKPYCSLQMYVPKDLARPPVS